MSPSIIKQMLVELTREGCRVEMLAHDPPSITFRSPAGARCALVTGNSDYRLARLEPEGLPSLTASFYSLRDALKAAVAS